MSGTYPNLSNPPIVEVVLDFDCDMPPGISMTALETPAKHAFTGQYPQVQPRYLQQMRFSSNEGVSNSSVQSSLQAWVFRQSDDKQLVQVRQSGFSFNRLAPYSNFDAYLPEIRRTWDIYRGFAAPLSVRALRLRYLNLINLPLEDSGGIELENYLTILPTLLESERFVLSGFLSQYTATDRQTGYQVAVTITPQPRDGNNLPILFDNTAFATGQWDAEDWDNIESILRSLRALKNQIFFDTVKESCTNLFR